MIADIVKNLWQKQNQDRFSFVFFGISFVFPKMDGHATNLLQNSWNFFWWLLTYIHSPGQSCRMKFNIFCFLEQASAYTITHYILRKITELFQILALNTLQFIEVSHQNERPDTWQFNLFLIHWQIKLWIERILSCYCSAEIWRLVDLISIMVQAKYPFLSKVYLCNL